MQKLDVRSFAFAGWVLALIFLIPGILIMSFKVGILPALMVGLIGVFVTFLSPCLVLALFAALYNKFVTMRK